MENRRVLNKTDIEVNQQRSVGAGGSICPRGPAKRAPKGSTAIFLRHEIYIHAWIGSVASINKT